MNLNELISKYQRGLNTIRDLIGTIPELEKLDSSWLLTSSEVPEIHFTPRAFSELVRLFPTANWTRHPGGLYQDYKTKVGDVILSVDGIAINPSERTETLTAEEVAEAVRKHAA